MNPRRWLPSMFDVMWADSVLSMVKEGGIIAFPSTGLEYRVSHEYKQLTLINPELLKNPELTELHEKTKIVFSNLFYDVVVPS